jgi:hypothetical protein
MIAAGADFVKLYNGLTPELLRAATAEAHRLGRKTTADLWGWAFPADSALSNVTDGFEHVLPFLEPFRHPASLLGTEADGPGAKPRGLPHLPSAARPLGFPRVRRRW